MTYDIVGIGIGPFNLGLAALAADIPSLQCLFMEQAPGFDWHPGLLLPGARMQVPYYADLVTLVHPQSPFSYMSFLHAHKRMYRFAIQDNPFPLRREYNRYCQWVAAQLPSLRFGYRCIAIEYEADKKEYGLQVLEMKTGQLQTFHAKQIVLGTGTQPHWPAGIAKQDSPMGFHASRFLHWQNQLPTEGRITLIGSGQSAAEVFQTLLTDGRATRQLAWFTRSPRLFPMETAPFTWEMSTPEYMDYFYDLPAGTRHRVLHQQDALYKGINQHLLHELYDSLYQRGLDPGASLPLLCTHTELQQVTKQDDHWQLELYHTEQGVSFTHHTDILILATGYAGKLPACIEQILPHIRRTPDGRQYLPYRNYSVDEHNSIFVQNGDLLTHGFNSADLSLGPYRNAVILNTILGYEHFSIERDISFQTFDCQRATGSRDKERDA